MIRSLPLLLMAISVPIPRTVGQGVAAQPREVAWSFYSDGALEQLSPAPAGPVDSLEVIGARFVADLQSAGYLFARIDSAEVGDNERGFEARVYATRGPEVQVGTLRIIGVTALDSLDVLHRMDVRPGRVFNQRKLESDFARILDEYESAGYPLVQIRLAEAASVFDTAPTIDLIIEVQEGAQLTLREVRLRGAERTRNSFASRITGLKEGGLLVSYDADEVRRRLIETGLFERVDPPELKVLEGGEAIVEIPVVEETPGSFDLVLGYVPNAAGASSAGLVGNGHIELRNLFGSGRTISLKLNRLPGNVSSVDAAFENPYLFGLPMGWKGQFSGLQQDSTYGKQTYGLEAHYVLGSGFQGFVSLESETTRPGQAGIRLRGGRQSVARSDALFLGFGVRYLRVDDRLNPRQGLMVETNFERGTKNLSTRLLTAAGDTTRERSDLDQKRLRTRIRGFIPVFRRQVVAVGLDGAILLSDRYDQSDLFRLGGATSLRGYNEQQFLGRAVARVSGEYRVQLDRRSFAYVFTDIGFVETPASDEGDAQRDLYPGFGFGMQFGTNVGVVNASYAVNDREGVSNGKVHVGLSIGL